MQPSDFLSQDSPSGRPDLLASWSEAVSQLTGGILIACDVRFRILSWPGRAESLLGWEKSRVEGFGLASVLSLPSTIMERLRHGLETQGYLSEVVVTARRPGGTRQLLRLSAQTLTDSYRQPMGYLFSARPPEAATASHMAQNQQLLDAIDLPIAIAGATGTVSLANRAAREKLGIQVGANCCASLCGEFSFACRTNRVLQTMSAVFWEAQTADIRMDMTASPLALNGVEADHVLFFGIPAQPHLSPELRKFFRAVDENLAGVLITDEAGFIEYVNPRLCSMLGYSPLQMIDQDLRRFTAVPPSRVGRSKAQPIRPGEREILALCEDGSQRPVQIAVSEIRDEHGAISNWVVVVEDISQRRQLEERERIAREQLAHSARLAAVGEIATMIAHEINQPLTGIANFGRGLLLRAQRGQLNAAQMEEPLKEILSQAERANEVIKNVRRMARRQAPETAPRAINELIRELMPTCRLLGKTAQTRIEVALTEDLPPVSIDRSQIEQVLMNLVKNAIDACRDILPADRLVIIHSSKTPQGAIAVDVEDWAPMPDATTLARLGEPFFSTKADGLGLGLSITRTLLESHGARLSVLPGALRGKSFHFELAPSP